jgi:peroxiredoxin
MPSCPLVVILAASLLAASIGAVEGSGPPQEQSVSPPVRIDKGVLLLYKGALKVSRRQMADERDDFSVSLEIGYLGLGDVPPERPGAGTLRRVLLLRSGESPDQEGPTFCEAVTLLAAPDLTFRTEIPAEDRAQRVSPFSFSHLPLGIFPRLEGAEVREWKAPARMEVLFSQTCELAMRHRVEAGPRAGTVRYRLEAEAGQRGAFRRDRVEVPFEVIELSQVHTISPADGRLLAFESRLGVRFPAFALPGEAEERRVEIDLVLSEASRPQEPRLAGLLREATLLREIERSLFVDLSPEVAESKAAAFEKEHPASHLAAFASGLGRQAPAVWPLASERRLYGKPAPDFTLPGLDGAPVTFSALLPGKVTLLAFFSLSCAACRAEAPCLSRFDQKYRDRGFQVIAVDSEAKDGREQVAAYARDLKLTHRLLVGGEQAAELFDFQGFLPTCFWIDRTGKVLRRETGFRPEMEKSIERTIEELLPPEAPAAPGAPAPARTPSKKEDP